MIDEIKKVIERHHRTPDEPGWIPEYCECGQDWPCDAYRTAEALLVTVMALEWYADVGNYNVAHAPMRLEDGAFHFDRGDTSREALSAAGKALNG